MSAGALAVMIACSRSPMPRLGCGIAAMAARTALSPSVLFALAFNSRTRARIASRSASENPVDFLSRAAALALGRLLEAFFTDIGVSSCKSAMAQYRGLDSTQHPILA